MVRDTSPISTPCGVSRVLSLVGGRWKGAIIWWIKDEERGFNELRKLLPGITARVLASQLRQLEDDGIVCRMESEATVKRVSYSLTKFGSEFIPLLDAIDLWGRKHLVASDYM